MNRNIIFNRLNNCFNKLGVDLNELDLNQDTLCNDIGLDSLDLIELVMYIEEEFNITMSDDEMNKYLDRRKSLNQLGDIFIKDHGKEIE